MWTNESATTSPNLGMSTKSKRINLANLFILVVNESTSRPRVERERFYIVYKLHMLLLY